MSKKLFHGSCLCKKIQFEANIDLSQNSQKCNCTFCRKSHLWGMKIDPTDFKLTSGEESMQTFAPKDHFQNFFCPTCGFTTHRHNNTSAWAGESVLVNLTALDDISLDEINSIPVTYIDGKANTWAPIMDLEETRML